MEWTKSETGGDYRLDENLADAENQFRPSGCGRQGVLETHEAQASKVRVSSLIHV